MSNSPALLALHGIFDDYFIEFLDGDAILCDCLTKTISRNEASRGNRHDFIIVS